MFTKNNHFKILYKIFSITMLLAFSGNIIAFASNQEHATPNPIILSEYSWIMYLVNFIILYLVLKKILWKPVTKFLDNRTNTINEKFEKSDKAMKEALALKQTYEDLMENAKMEHRQILLEAKQEAQKKYDAIITAAYKDAEKYRNKMQIELNKEHDIMIEKLKDEITNLAILSATTVVKKNMDEQSNREYIQTLLDNEEIK